eukprot:871427_1
MRTGLKNKPDNWARPPIARISTNPNTDNQQMYVTKQKMGVITDTYRRCFQLKETVQCSATANAKSAKENTDATTNNIVTTVLTVVVWVSMWYEDLMPIFAYSSIRYSPYAKLVQPCSTTPTILEQPLKCKNIEITGT